MNDRRAEVVGICKTFSPYKTTPVAYTRWSLAVGYAPQERQTLSFVLAGRATGLSTEEVCRRIQEQTGLLALSPDAFMRKTIRYYLRRTAIPVVFGITVLLGFAIGAAIVGQGFYLFTRDNLKQFGLLKAIGVEDRRIVGMVLAQGLAVGLPGYSIGLGLAAGLERLTVWHQESKGVPVMAHMAWPVPLAVGLAIALILGATALVSVRTVLRLEPVAVFR